MFVLFLLFSQMRRRGAVGIPSPGLLPGPSLGSPPQAYSPHPSSEGMKMAVSPICPWMRCSRLPPSPTLPGEGRDGGSQKSRKMRRRIWRSLTYRWILEDAGEPGQRTTSLLVRVMRYGVFHTRTHEHTTPEELLSPLLLLF